MTYSPVLIIHISAGILAVLAGFVALFAPKGFSVHRIAGKVFAVSMLVMAAGGGYVSLIKSQWTNVFAAVLTFYLVATAWLTVRHKRKKPGAIEAGLLVVALAAGTTGWAMGLAAHKSSAAIYLVFGSVLLLSAAGDVRMFIRGGVSGAQRLVRHLWRMCFALLIAAGSFFLGTASDPVLRKNGLRAQLFTKEIRHTHLPEVPVILVVVLMIFWLIRVKFSSKYKKPETPLSTLSS
jgi:uncharacterized membrane protein